MRRSVIALPLLAVPLAAAACGGSKSSSTSTTSLPGDPAAAVEGAARKTVQAGSEHAKIAGTVAAKSQTVAFAGSGDFDTKAQLGSLSIDVSLGGLNTTVVEVSHGTDVYVRSELVSAMLPSGKTWVKVDLSKMKKSSGFDLSSLLAQDPAHALSQLQKSLHDVSKVGEAQIGGTATTHYRARIDLGKVSGAPAGTGRYDVWIGDDGYVHRVKAKLSAQGTTSTVTTDLSAFGKPVEVTIPPASETFVGDNSTIPGLGG